MPKTIAAVVGALLVLLISIGTAAKAEPVDIQLALIADVSRSVDNDEFRLQREGFATALTDPRVMSAIRSGAVGAIGVTFIEWSGDDEQKVVVDWTVIRDGESSAVVADQIRTAPRSFTGRTSISAAIDFTVRRFEASGLTSPRKVIDVSGDGTNNAGRDIAVSRDEAVAGGFVINGLAIINLNPNFGFIAHTQPPGGLPNYYREHVMGGPGAFVLQIDDFHSFADAMATKLLNEIATGERGWQQALAAR